MNSSIRQKINREMRINRCLTQMDLTDIYKTFNLPHQKEYIFFSAPHETFSKTDHILGNKANLKRLKKK